MCARKIHGHFLIGPEHPHRAIPEIISRVETALHLRRNDLQFWLMLVQPEHLGALHAAHEISFCNSHEEPQLSTLRNCFLQHLCVLSLHLWRSDDPHFPVKAEDPTVERFARGHQHAGLKCFAVHGKSLDVLSEAIDNVIHHAVVADKRHALRLTTEHAEHRVDAGYIKILRLRYRVFFENVRRQSDAVDTEGCDAVLVGVAEQVVTVAIPYQHPRTAHIFRAAVFQLLLLAAVILEIRKRNLFPGVDRRMDRIDDVVDLFVFRLDAAPGAQTLRRFLFASPAPTGSIIIVSEQADGVKPHTTEVACFLLPSLR